MLAKRFLFVCAGLLCLALAYHLGAASVRAQAAATIDGASIQGVPGLPAAFRASGVVGRTFYLLDGNGGQSTVGAPIPGSERVIATDPGYINVLLEGGDMLQYDGTAWRRIGSLLGGGTPARLDTWGSVKVRYRK